MREGDKPDLVVKQVVERFERQMAGRVVDLPLADFGAHGLKPPPGTGVGLVILIGDDDRIPRLQPAGECLAEHIGVVRSRRADMHPVHRHVERFGETGIAQIHGLAGLL